MSRPYQDGNRGDHAQHALRRLSWGRCSYSPLSPFCLRLSLCACPAYPSALTAKKVEPPWEFAATGGWA